MRNRKRILINKDAKLVFSGNDTEGKEEQLNILKGEEEAITEYLNEAGYVTRIEKN